MKKLRFKEISLFLSLLLAGSTGFSKDIYVSPQGDDGNPGTREKPLKSLEKASGMLEPGDICYLLGGIYHETLKPTVQGTPDKPVTYKAEEGGLATISAMDELPAGREEGKLLEFPVDWSLAHLNMVFCDGEPLTLARWPNKLSKKAMDLEPATIIANGSSPKKIRNNDFPSEWTEKSLDGATVWVNAESKWSSWTSLVTKYNPYAKAIDVEGFEENWWIDERHNPAREHRTYGKGVFYVAGSRDLLDAPGEWYLDESAGKLSVILPEGKTAATSRIEMKKREYCADLSDAKYVHLVNIHMTGAAISLSEAEGCLVKGAEISHFCACFGINSPTGIAENTGIMLGGKNNTVRDCEIYGSDGNGIIFSGERNAVINCDVHDLNYLGSHDAAAVKLTGRAHLISHNTIHNTGRVCISMGGGAHVIQYNHIYNPGRNSEDLGVLKCAGLDADNLVIHHNVIHNDNNKFIGIYFDNYTNNIIAHHNVVWGMKDGVRSNRPGHFHIVYNNTVIPDINNKWGPWPGIHDQEGNVIVNNVVKTGIEAKDYVYVRGNQEADFNIPSAGEIPAFIGESNVPDFPPYYGALPEGEKMFAFGHNLRESPEVSYNPELPYVRNYVKNGCFDYILGYAGLYPPQDIASGAIPHWKPIMAGTARAEYFPGFNFPENPEQRFSIYGNSLALDGKVENGVIQTVGDLSPGRKYKFIAFLKTDGKANVTFNIKAGTRIIGLVQSWKEFFDEGSNWKYITTSFKIPSNLNQVELEIINQGPGKAYIDDVGIIPELN